MAAEPPGGTTGEGEQILKSISAFAFICLLLFPSIDFAQTQRRRGGRARRPVATRSARAEERGRTEELSAARGRVVEQIKLLTRFLYLFGRISNNIEMSEAAQAENSGGGEARAQAIELTNRTKAALRENLANVRAGLNQLEADVRGTPSLSGFYTRIAGVSDYIARAEASAAANRFDEAGRNLIEAINRLTDALRETN